MASKSASIGGLDEVLAIGQIVFSLTSLSNVDAVTFQVGGTLVSVPRPDGVLLARPVTSDDYSELLDR